MSFDKTAVRERESIEYISEHRRGNSGQSDDRRWLVEKEPTAPWGRAQQDGKFVLANIGGNKFRRFLRNRDKSGKLKVNHAKQ